MASMDGHRFDDLTRTLATDASRRSLIRGLLGGAALFGLGRSGGVAQQGKTTICHQTGSGFYLITVANPALDAHYGHGDFAYTDCCTDGECATGSICAAGSCTPVCTDDQCPDDQACQDGVCTPFSCPPHLAPIDHACQHPCAYRQGHCNDLGGPPDEYNCNCVALVSGEAVCLTGSTVFDGPLGVCTSDEHCQNAGTPGYDWRCLRNPEWEEGGYCYGDPVFCEDWTLL
jgi:hypothetical protein